MGFLDCLFAYVGDDRDQPETSYHSAGTVVQVGSADSIMVQTHGSTWREENSGGGIIRNDEGVVIASFSHFYGEGSNNLAEFQALKDGMLLYKALRISPLLIKIDSSLVMTASRIEQADNWRLFYVLRKYLTLYSFDNEIIHEYRQKNFVANRLADWDLKYSIDLFNHFFIVLVDFSKINILLS